MYLRAVLAVVGLGTAVADSSVACERALKGLAPSGLAVIRRYGSPPASSRGQRDAGRPASGRILAPSPSPPRI